MAAVAFLFRTGKFSLLNCFSCQYFSRFSHYSSEFYLYEKAKKNYYGFATFCVILYKEVPWLLDFNRMFTLVYRHFLTFLHGCLIEIRKPLRKHFSKGTLFEGFHHSICVSGSCVLRQHFVQLCDI